MAKSRGAIPAELKNRPKITLAARGNRQVPARRSKPDPASRNGGRGHRAQEIIAELHRLWAEDPETGGQRPWQSAGSAGMMNRGRLAVPGILFGV